jgi:GWxTD domain-containing protein
MKKRTIAIYLLLLIFLFSGCSRKMKLHPGPGRSGDTFFETARFIMTGEEIHLYRHLPDQQARKEFIEDFWQKRDPDPGTEENESRIEFEKRIEYANKWFRDLPEGRGWDTERGHILLQLGIPDQRETRTTTLRGTTWLVKIDTWLYYEYQLVLQFVDLDGFGKYKLRGWPTTLIYALDQAKSDLTLAPKDQKQLERSFKFAVKFKKNKNLINISIPVKNMEFQEKQGTIVMGFEIEVFVYRDFKKIDHLKKEAHFGKSKEELLQLKKLEIDISYSPPAPIKGSYHLDVIIKELSTASKYRNFSRFKIRN